MKYQTLVLNKPNINNFAKERNNLLKDAREDWIFFVDTDEQVSSNLEKELKKMDPGKFDGFYVKRKIYFLGNYVGEDKVLRLGKKDAGKWTRKIHEVWDIKGRVGLLHGYLIHNTATDFTSYLRKMQKYARLHAEENLKEGKKSSIFKIAFYPLGKFFQNIFLGRKFVFSVLQSYHSFLAWKILWKLQRTK